MADATVGENPDRDLLGEDVLEVDDQEIVQILFGYANEAEQGRREGSAPRDEVWEANWDRYWGRYSQENKAPWQSRHVMPEIPQFVDRWAAAMREALDAAGQDFYMPRDLSGQQDQLMQKIKQVMDTLLSRCSFTPDGHRTGFSNLFEDQMKMGAIMACCATVTWRDDDQGGWIACETVDPREVWFDPKHRGMYRLRRQHMDKHQMMALARATNEQADEDIYDMDELEKLAAEVDETLRVEKEESQAHGDGGEQITGRMPIKMEEWLCDLINDEGEVIRQNALIVVANEKFVVRGPEPNPFLHERDWIVYSPMVSVPLSVYGRSYMEDWSSVADAFIEMTNLVLDASFTSAINAFIANPNMLEDPTQIADGISPNKIFTTAEEIDDVRRFIGEIQTGTLDQGAVEVWQALKTELREGAKLSEIALGQLAPNSRTSATEIQQVQQSGTAQVRSMARTIETRFIEPMLEMVWKTALQHLDFSRLSSIIGEDWARMFNERADEFLEDIRFDVRGISGLIDRQSKLQNLLQAIQTIGQSEQLAQSLFRRISPEKLTDHLFTLFGLNMDDLRETEVERIQAGIQEAREQAAAQQEQAAQQQQGQAGEQSPEQNPQRQAERRTGGEDLVG